MSKKSTHSSLTNFTLHYEYTRSFDDTKQRLSLRTEKPKGNQK